MYKSKIETGGISMTQSDPKDDYQVQSPQEYTETQRPDPITNELHEDITEELGMNPNEFNKELNKLDVDANSDDWRESVEGQVENSDTHDES